MRLEVNGKPVEAKSTNLADLLAELEYGDRKVATAVNRDFVRAADRAKTTLREGDAVEVVVPRQGG